MVTNERIKELIAQSLADPGHFLVDLVVNSKSNPLKITVVLDGDKGISIDDCATVSRTFSALLDEENSLENYALEVTTPGLDQPLKLKRQYVKNIGREVKIQLKDKKIERGKLVESTEGSIVIEHEVKEGKKKEIKKTTFAFEEIERTLVEVSFK
jgi:ribosome maturation factor RimP